MRPRRANATGARRGRSGTPVLVGVALVAALIALSIGVLLHAASDLSATDPPRPATHALIFIVDGLPVNAAYNPSTPNVAALAHDGVIYTNAWIGELEAVTPVSEASLSTGDFPRANGVVGAEWSNSKGNVRQPTTPLNAKFGSLDQVMESHDTPSLIAIVKARRPTARVLSVSGSDCASADAAGTWEADYVLCAERVKHHWIPSSVVGHALTSGNQSEIDLSIPVARGPGLGPTSEGWQLGQQNDWVAEYAVRAMRLTHPIVSIVHFPELGAVLPWVPENRRSSLTKKLLAGVDRDIGRVIRELQREHVYNQTAVVVSAGQMYAPARATVARARLQEAMIAAGGLQTYIDGDGAIVIGLRDPLQAQPVAESIRSEHITGIDAIYYRTQTDSGWKYRAQFQSNHVSRSMSRSLNYLLSTMISGVAPDVVIIPSPRSIGSPNRMSGLARTETTGGAQWNTQHIPLIIAGHGTLTGTTSAFPARLVDIAPTVERLLGLRPAHQQGVVLADSLLQPSSLEQARQSNTDRRLGPLIEALKARVANR